MPLSLKSAARSILGAIPLPVYRALIRRDVVVFLYHVVGPPDLAHVRHLYRYKSPEAFEADLIDLARRFRLVSYDEIATGEARSGRPVAHLTFDDGYAECHALARPILLKRGVPCTFFLTTELIDNRSMFHRNKASLCIETLFECPDREASALLCDLGRRLGRPLADRDAFRRWVLSLPAQEEARIDEVCGLLRLDVPAYLRNRQPYLSTDQIRRLAAEGFTIGAHGRRHVPLGILSDSAARDEIVGSCRTIQGLTGRDRVPFAFPHSADGVSRLFLRSLVGAHPVVGRLFDTHRLRRDDSLIVNRITADSPPADDRSSNVPELLHAAYRDETSEWLRQFLPRHLPRPAPDRPPGQPEKG